MIGFKSKNLKSKSRRRKRKQNTRRKYIRYGLLAIISYLFFLIATLPASVAISFINKNSQLKSQIQITAVSGTVWSGTAASVQASGINIGRLKWDLKLLPLLLGKLSTHINFNNNSSFTDKISGSGLVSVSLSGQLKLIDFSAMFTTDSIAPLLYGLPARFTGDINLHINEMVIMKGKRFNLKSRIVITNAGLISPQRIDYGDILIQVSAKENGSQFILTDQGGPLILDGNIKIKGNGLYSLNLGMAARSTASSDLESGLRFLGQRDSTGKYHYKMNGKLQNW